MILSAILVFIFLIAPGLIAMGVAGWIIKDYVRRKK